MEDRTLNVGVDFYCITQPQHHNVTRFYCRVHWRLVTRHSSVSPSLTTVTCSMQWKQKDILGTTWPTWYPAPGQWGTKLCGFTYISIEILSLKLDMRCWMFVGHRKIFIWQRFCKKLLDQLRKVTKQPSFMFLPEICHINIIELIWTTWATVSYHLNVFSIKDNLQGSRHSEQK